MIKKSNYLFLLTLSLILIGCSQPEIVVEEVDVTVTMTAVSPTATTAETAVSPTISPTNTNTPQPATEPTVTKPAEATSIPPTVTPIPPTPITSSGIPGALIQISMQSSVGVLLDEFPTDIRDRVAAEILTQPDSIWLARAERQIRLTRLRLNFRNFSFPDKGQLPLPPSELWDIQLDPAGSSRQTIQGHDLVMLGYTLSTTLLTDEASPEAAEPALADIGGVWEELFIFPADPDLLLQRTDNACINEGGFPPNSFDSENAWHFFDFDCEADSGGARGCHRTQLPTLSCREALVERIGEVETVLRFERLPWDNTVADTVRIGFVTNLDTPDLLVVGNDLETNRITYRYIEPENCALEEGAVEDSGWRRLLQFDATVYNIGGKELHIGPISAIDPANNVFEYNPCHAHFHYSNYGDFFLQNFAQLTGSKQAFCVQSTNRLSNNETSPLTHSYSCRAQGIQAGWVDEYIAGLDAQWIDITNLDIPEEGTTVQLGFRSNGDQFLCEGTVVVDRDGEQMWEASGFTTEDGLSIKRPQCEFNADWDENNEAVRDVFVPATGSFVTTPCANDEIGPLRNCGFVELEVEEDNQVCDPDTSVEKTFDLAAEIPFVIRVCQRSAILGTGVACTFENSLANALMTNHQNTISFPCPLIRDAEEIEGGYALYVAAIISEEPSPLLLPPQD